MKVVQRFVGFVTYLAKFLPRLSEVGEPLRRLMDKDTIWHWLPKHDAEVREIKQLVTQTPVLRYYNVSTCHDSEGLKPVWTWLLPHAGGPACDIRL